MADEKAIWAEIEHRYPREAHEERPSAPYAKRVLENVLAVLGGGFFFSTVEATRAVPLLIDEFVDAKIAAATEDLRSKVALLYNAEYGDP